MSCYSLDCEPFAGISFDHMPFSTPRMTGMSDSVNDILGYRSMRPIALVTEPCLLMISDSSC